MRVANGHKVDFVDGCPKRGALAVGSHHRQRVAERLAEHECARERKRRCELERSGLPECFILRQRERVCIDYAERDGVADSSTDTLIFAAYVAEREFLGFRIGHVDRVDIA